MGQKPRLVATVLAIEATARGPVWRRLENVVARGLIAFGGGERFSRMSLGPAQIQPRRVGLASDRRTLAALIDPKISAQYCAWIVEDARDKACLEDSADSWNPVAWRRFGLALNGSRDYGDLASAVYSRLGTRDAG